jgi:hypothetical protein
MLNRSGLILGIGIMAISAFAAISAIGWPLKTQLFPLVISIPLFCLAAAEVACLWFSGSRFSRTKDFQHPPSDVPSSVAVPRTLRAAGWILAFFFAIGLVGFMIAVPLFVFLYLKLESRESWLFSIVFSAVLWGAFYGLFDYLLHLPFPTGWLF